MLERVVTVGERKEGTTLPPKKLCGQNPIEVLSEAEGIAGV
jgi:hypothetical protein